MPRRQRVTDEQSRLYLERKNKLTSDRQAFREKRKIKNKTPEIKTELRNEWKRLKTEKDIVKRMKPRTPIQRFFYNTGRVLKLFLIWFFVIASILGVAAYIVVSPMIKEAKDIAYEKLATIDENTFNFLSNTEIYAADGSSIATIVKSNYSYTDISDVPEYIQKGYIAVEDRRFLNHNGIDYKSLARAGVALIKNKGHITQGGSTITQQVIKNMLLTQERSYKRKLVEFFIAPELEKRYSKSDIMEFYVNSCYYGNGCYGVGSASSYFFGKTPKELTLAECAMLVGLSNNPSAYSPINHPEEAKAKRALVLRQMVEQGVCTQEQADQANAEEFNLILEKEAGEKESYQASYAIHCATLKLMELNKFNFQYIFANDDEYQAYRERYTNIYNQYSQEIRAGGYKLYTSFDNDIQEKLQASVDKGLSGFKEKDDISGRYLMQGASVVVDNKTGYIVAIVGGRGTDDEFNRGFLAKRQPGSTMKPIGVYGPAMDTGRYYPSLIMEDKYIDGGPQNYNRKFSGNVTLRTALARSLNTIPFQIILDIKPITGMEYLGKMRFDTLVPSDNTGSFALGGITYGVRVCDMAKAYYTVQNDGVYTDNTCLTKIEFQQEGVVYDGAVKKERVYERDVAYILTDMLKTVANDGTGVALSGHPTGAKTGTTSDNKDLWYVGFTKHYTTAVWVGFDTPKEIPNAAGGRYAVNIWSDVMTKLHKGLSAEDWDKPSTVVMKNVDKYGKITDNNTGKSDLFSQTLIDREEEAKKVKESEYLKQYEEEWLAKDANRQQIATQLVESYEAVVIMSENDISLVDEAYKKAESAINIISDVQVKQTLTDRLMRKKTSLDVDRKPFEELIRVRKEQEAEEQARIDAERAAERKRLQEQAKLDEEAKQAGKEQAKESLLLKADESIKKLASLSINDSSTYAYAISAQSAVESCVEYTEYDNLKERLCKELDRLGIQLEINKRDTVYPSTRPEATSKPSNGTINGFSNNNATNYPYQGGTSGLQNSTTR